MNEEYLSKKAGKIIEWVLLLLLFTPLLVGTFFAYPYVFLKSVVFKTAVEIMFVLAGYLFLKRKLPKVAKNPLLISTVLFFSLWLFASLFGVNFGESFWGNFERMEGVFTYLHLAVYFLLLIMFFKSPGIWRRVFWTTAFVSILVDLIAIGQWLGLKIKIADYVGRTGGTLGNAGYLAATLIVSLILLTYYFYLNKKARWFFGSVIALNVFTIFISATRGAIIALAGAIFLGLAASLFKKDLFRKSFKIAIGSILALMVLGVVSIFVFKASPIVQKVEPLRRLTSISKADVTSVSRLLVWKYSWNAFLARPIVGWGLENYNMAFDRHYDGQTTENYFDRAHNLFFDNLVTGGLIMFILYLAMLAMVFKQIFKLYKNQKIDFVSSLIFVCGFLAYLVQGLFAFDTLNNWLFLLLFFALLVYLNHSSSDNFYGYFEPNKKIWGYAGFCVVIVLTVFSLIFGIIKPSLASWQTHIAVKNWDINDNALSQKYFNLALKNITGNYGREDILVFLGNLMDDELRKTDQPKDLDWAIGLFQTWGQNIPMRNGLPLGFMHNFKAVVDPSYFDKTIDLLNRMKSLSPSRQDVYFHFGQLYALKGDKENALANFKHAVEIKKNFDALWNLAVGYMYFKDSQAIASTTREMLALPDIDNKLKTPQIKQLIPFLDAVQDNLDIEQLLKFLVGRDDAMANYYGDLAIVELRLNKVVEAGNYAAKAVEMDPAEKERLKPYFIFPE